MGVAPAGVDKAAWAAAAVGCVLGRGGQLGELVVVVLALGGHSHRLEGGLAVLSGTRFGLQGTSVSKFDYWKDPGLVWGCKVLGCEV